MQRTPFSRNLTTTAKMECKQRTELVPLAVCPPWQPASMHERGRLPGRRRKKPLLSPHEFVFDRVGVILRMRLLPQELLFPERLHPNHGLLDTLFRIGGRYTPPVSDRTVSMTHGEHVRRREAVIWAGVLAKDPGMTFLAFPETACMRISF